VFVWGIALAGSGITIGFLSLFGELQEPFWGPLSAGMSLMAVLMIFFGSVQGTGG
jgi:peptidoglycan/LPS O-acetylase OafA/YrhL